MKHKIILTLTLPLLATSLNAAIMIDDFEEGEIGMALTIAAPSQHQL